MLLSVWTCHNPKCCHDVLLLPQTLQGISDYLQRWPTTDRFVDFACPVCGHGNRRSESDIPLREFLTELRYPPTLFHESLKCEEKGCDAHARVHTLADCDPSTIAPRIAVPKWKLDGITCFYGHPVKQPPEALPSVLNEMKEMERHQQKIE